MLYYSETTANKYHLSRKVLIDTKHIADSLCENPYLLHPFIFTCTRVGVRIIHKKETSIIKSFSVEFNFSIYREIEHFTWSKLINKNKW